MIQVPPRNVRAALVAAQSAAKPVELRLLDGSTHLFHIEQVLDDALIGRRDIGTHPCIVMIHSISMMEFTDA